MKTKIFAVAIALLSTTAFANTGSGIHDKAKHDRCIQQNCEGLTGVQLDECTANCASQHSVEDNAKHLPSRKHSGVN